MKFSKSILIAAMVGLTATFSGCGGASGNSNDTDSTTFNEAEVVGDRADISTSNAGLDYADMFSEIDDTENYDIIELTGMNDNLSTFAMLAELSNLDLKLNQAGPVTVFVPTNEAFENMPEEEFEKLIDPRNKAQLARFLQRHVLPGEVTTVDFDDSQAIETASEEEIIINTEMSGNVIYIGGAQIVKSDIDASDGVVHVVNSVIEPTRDVFTD